MSKKKPQSSNTAKSVVSIIFLLVVIFLIYSAINFTQEPKLQEEKAGILNLGSSNKMVVRGVVSESQLSTEEKLEHGVSDSDLKVDSVITKDNEIYSGVYLESGNAKNELREGSCVEIEVEMLEDKDTYNNRAFVNVLSVRTLDNEECGIVDNEELAKELDIDEAEVSDKNDVVILTGIIDETDTGEFTITLEENNLEKSYLVELNQESTDILEELQNNIGKEITISGTITNENDNEATILINEISE